MMRRRRSPMTRRSFLHGASATVALPFLESWRHREGRQPEARPARTAFFYVPNGVVQRAWHPAPADDQVLRLSPTLEPLAAVRDEVTLLTNLGRVKVAGTDGHAQAGACWLSSAAPHELSPAGYPLKKTVDQLIAAQTGEDTAFRSLELSCNPYEDNKESIYFDNISWYGDGHVARSLRDPGQVFDRLFSVREHAAHRSVLDVVLEDARSVERELGRADQAKLGEYLDSVRTVERQIERVTARQSEIDALGLEPPTRPWQQMERGEYLQVMGDLMILALQTDLTRVVTMMTSPERWSSPLTVHGLFEKPVQHHGMTHAQGEEKVRQDLEALDRWHVDQYAQLVRKMSRVEDGDGSLLDHTLFLFGSGISDGSLHVYTDLPTVIAGRGCGAVRPGRHVRSDEGTPIANLWVTMLRAAGVEVDSVGDSTGSLDLI